jgi:hypothetical protein
VRSSSVAVAGGVAVIPVVIKLRCPDCGQTFKWPGGQAWPDFCPHCRAPVSKGSDEIAMPFIRSAKTKANDALYRQMEDASEQRAQEAASMLNVPVSDVSDLKITNMRDGMKPGDTAFIPVQNDVSRLMDNPGMVAAQQQALAYAANTRVGPEVGHANYTQNLITREHSRRFGGVTYADTPGGGRRGLD